LDPGACCQQLGIDSTPTFFINGIMHRGDMTVEELESLVNTDLKS
jgi:protein-disulfide isomerase